jgi:glycosyltransferase involved in cell wall biosynthesis
MQKAKQLGAIAVKEGASSHPLAQYNLLKSEFEKYKTKYRHSARALERSLKEIQMCDYIFVPSDFAYQTYIDNKVAEEKLVKIPFGVDLEMFSPKKRKTGDRFRAVFVGQIGLRKGVQYLLEAWRTLGLKNAELVLRGRIMPDARKLIRHYRSKINLVTPGHGDPGQDYLKSDIFVFPSIEEGSALASYEAMASGMPVIVTQNTGSIARNGRDGFVIPIRDIKILASKIRYLYDNPDERRRMGKNARKQAEKYPWDNYGNKIVQTYQRILNERKK